MKCSGVEMVKNTFITCIIEFMYCMCFRYRIQKPSYSDGPSFGIHLILDSPNGSVIRVGDSVYVQAKS